MDGNVANKTYPRATDPAYGKSLTITNATATTVTVNEVLLQKLSILQHSQHTLLQLVC